MLPVPSFSERHLTLLDQFLVEAFSQDELIQFLDQHFGAMFVAELPSTGSSARTCGFHAVRSLARRGLVDANLFSALGRARPQRRIQLAQIQSRLLIPDLDEVEQQTVVWKPQSAQAESPRYKWVLALEEQLLARERLGHDVERRARLDASIDEFTRKLRSAPIPSPGSIVAYARLEQPIGAGNFGTVWKARRLGSGELVAVKIFNLDRLTDGVMLWRFRRSIKALATLGKRGGAPSSIPKLVSVAADDLAFSMVFLGEGTLEHIARRGWSLATKIAVFVDICRATDFAHDLNIIHRDIKPANVLLDASLRPVLVDYDIADIRFVTQISVAKGGLGTPVFAAPEQLEQGELADERSDIYSLGRLLHYLLLERSPGYQIERDPALANLRGFPPGLLAVVRRATQWDPDRRYPCVKALIEDIERCQTGLAAVKARASAARRWVRQNASLLAMFSTLTGSSIGFAAFQQEHARVQEVLAESQRRAMTVAAERQVDAQVSAAKIQGNLAALGELQGELVDLTRDVSVLGELPCGRAEGSAALGAELHARIGGLQAKLAGIRHELDDSSQALRVQQEAISEALAPRSSEGILQRAGDGSTIASSLIRSSRAEAPADPRREAPPAAPSPHLALPPPPTDPMGAPTIPPAQAGLLDAVRASMWSPRPDAPAKPGPAPASRSEDDPPEPEVIRTRRPSPPTSRDQYRALREEFERQAGDKLRACLQRDRFMQGQPGVRLDINVQEGGTPGRFYTTPRVGSGLSACIAAVLRSLELPTNRGESFEYFIDRR